jgi:hypothetical protein
VVLQPAEDQVLLRREVPEERARRHQAVGEESLQRRRLDGGAGHRLMGLRGRGHYTAVADDDGRWHAEDEFAYWFVPTASG